MKKVTLLTSLFSALFLASCTGANVHQHTFETSWTKDNVNHWHAASCEHKEFTKDLAPHVDSNKDGKCDVCDYDIPEVHEHKFETTWSKDSINHWHAATCEHTELTKDLGKHVDEDKNNICDVCEYEIPVTPKTKYTFKFIGFNCSLNNESTYTEDTSVDLTFTVDEGYHLEEIITVLGTDTYDYDSKEKTLSLEVSDNITVVAHALKDIEEKTPNYGDAFYKLSPDITNYDIEGNEGLYSIASHTLAIGNQCWLTYVVFDDVSSGYDEKGVEVWKNLIDAQSKIGCDYTCEFYDRFNYGSEAMFDEYLLKDLSFINLVDTVYARPYYIKDGVKTYGEIDEWSMLQSCHEMYNSGQLMESSFIQPDYVLYGYELIRTTIAYASRLQELFDYKKDHLAEDEIYKYGVAHIDTKLSGKIIFTTGDEIANFFEDINNCTEDMTLIFDMPLKCSRIAAHYKWDHAIYIDSKTTEIEFDAISAVDKCPRLEINNLKVGTVTGYAKQIVAYNCSIGSLFASDNQVMLYETNLNKLSLNTCDKCEFNSCFMTNVGIDDSLFMRDCGTLTFNNCQMIDCEFNISDTWSDYNQLDTILLFKGNSSEYKDTHFKLDLSRSGSNVTFQDSIYCHGCTFDCENNFASIMDGFYDDNSFHNVVAYGGYYSDEPRPDIGITVAPGYRAVFGPHQTYKGTFDYKVEMY